MKINLLLANIIIGIFISPVMLVSMDQPYYMRKYWGEQDVIKAIEDNGIIHNNSEAIISCFLSKQCPLHTWEPSIKKNILKKLCLLLEFDEELQEEYLTQFIETEDALISRGIPLPYEKSSDCSNDTIMHLFNQLHLKRWNPAAPALTHPIAYVPSYVRTPEYYYKLGLAL